MLMLTTPKMLSTFLDRAEQLAKTRELVKDDGSYAFATALVSVHAAIALNDALLIRLGQNRSKAEDHRSAVKQVDKVCRAKHLDRSGVAQLKFLISVKTDVSYGEAPVTPERAMKLAVASERFQKWAYSTMGGLR